MAKKIKHKKTKESEICPRCGTEMVQISESDGYVSKDFKCPNCGAGKSYFA